DPAQKTLQFRYDPSGRLVERTDAMGYSVKFRYDAYGRLLQLTNENDESYRFGWDELDRLVAQKDLDGSGRLYAYNAGKTYSGHNRYGYDLKSINARGKHTHFRYDARGYLVESERPGGRIDRYEIDVAGQLTRYVDPAQKTLQFRYAPSDRLVETGAIAEI
ncbi:TPA: RHS repeat protein, partial [Pseudomonas putida]|nr:RHS repeat protein [Pseudomonas putida]